MNYVIEYDVVAVALAVMLLVHYYSKRFISTSQTRVFLVLLWGTLGSSILDIVTVYQIAYRVSPIALHVTNVIYLLAFNMVPLLYLLYLIVVLQDAEKYSRAEWCLTIAPYTLSFILIIISPLTGWVYSYDVVNGYGHGLGFYVLYVVCALYMLQALIKTVKYREELTKSQRFVIYFYMSLLVFGVVLQIVFPDILVMQLAIMLSIMLLYLSLENPEDDIDKTLGAYNKLGFLKVLKNEFERKKEFQLIIINFYNYREVQEIVGINASLLLMKNIITLLRIKITKLPTFSFLDGQVILLLDDKGDHPERIKTQVLDLFEKPIWVDSNQFLLSPFVIIVDCPKEADSIENIMMITDASNDILSKVIDDREELVRELLDNKRREDHIIQLMTAALNYKNFEVYYQPIYSVEKQRISSAEALIRLRDEDGRFISPEEFIPLAEKNGLIIGIGQYVFESVCRTMSENRLWEKGIDYIEINLSVIQCIQENLHRRLVKIMDNYGIPYSAINLEITETATAVTKDALLENINCLYRRGVSFSLDDYGTGYSSISNIIEYPFHIIKLDKSIVWNAFEHDKALQVLIHTIKMIKALDMCIVAEGIEKKEHVKLLTELGVDYFQGYYFSKPIPELEFLELVKKI